MNITISITRHCYSKYGVDGKLSIDGQPVCDSCEHPHNYIPPGTYSIRIAHNKALHRKVPTLPNGAIVRIGNGPFSLHDGSIIIGKSLFEGVLIDSAFHFNRLIDRLDKAQNRGDKITLTIE